MRKYLLLALLILGAAWFFSTPVNAATPPSGDEGSFSLQITPSPLVTTVKPGQKTTLELKIRNAGEKAQALKIEPRSFKLVDEQVKLDDTEPPEIAGWLSFSQPKFTVQPGEWVTQEVNINVPKEAGFSYSFALIISRQADPKPTSAGRLIKGSVADFVLVNVDRPGASRKLDVAQFSTTKNVYEYLPANIGIKIKNTGNTIVQPYGNIFIQRGKDSKSPISTLAVNESKGYILPSTTRTLATKWDNGFPVYKDYTAADGSTKQKLSWNWSKVSELRIGRYTAQLVAVYNDGQHDIPIRGEIQFWVIPWKIIIVLVIVLLLVLLGVWSLVRKIISLVKRGKRLRGKEPI